MILLIDNYDSFVFNLARYVNELGGETLVKRHDAVTLDEIKELRPSHIIISPGPGAPSDAGISLEVIRVFGKSIPLLGVCLGHQVIGEAYGATIARATYPMHGKSSRISHDEKNLFQGIENPLSVARYHSLIVSKDNFPSPLSVTAHCEKGEIMALQHRDYPVFGVQFHPESVLTLSGHQLLQNFLRVR
jgi:anthranilate synthase component 2